MEFCVKLLSLPLWERGLKCHALCPLLIAIGVAPLVGAWIVILHALGFGSRRTVAPLVGAWIEIPAQ